MTDDARYLASLDDTALDHLFSEWTSGRPRAGALVLVPESQRAQVPEIQERARAAGLALAGAVFPALVKDDHFVSEGAWFLRFDERPVCVLEDAPPATHEQAATAERLVARLRPHLEGAEPRTLVLVCDALNPSIATLLDELYLRLADRVDYTGANAGSETFQPIPCLFDDTRFVERGVLALLLPRRSGAALAHGYPVPEKITTATSTQGNRIVQIDWRPAFDVYRELAREQYGLAVDRETFYSSAVHFPFGVVRANGVILVRIPVALEEDGSLFCIGEVPPSSVLALLKAPTVDSAGTVEVIVDAFAREPDPSRDMLLFYCAGRRLHLGVETACTEIRDLKDRSRATQLAGALSLGEIGAGARWNYPLFHNAALVASRWNPG